MNVHKHNIRGSNDLYITAVDNKKPSTAGIANPPLLFLEHRIPMPECIYGSPFYESSGGRQIRLPLLGGDAPD